MAEDYPEGWMADPFQADCVRFWDGSGWKGRAVTYPEFRAAPNEWKGLPDWTFFEKTFNDESAGWHGDSETGMLHWVSEGFYTGFGGSPYFVYGNICEVLEKYDLAAPGTSLIKDQSIISEKLANLPREYRWAISDLCRWMKIEFDEAKEKAEVERQKALLPTPPYLVAYRSPESTVSLSNQQIPGDGTEEGWVRDVEKLSEMIFWNTEYWSKRMTVKDMVLVMFHGLDEDAPAHWDLKSNTVARDWEVFQSLLGRFNQQSGWYIDPQSDLRERRVRYWDGTWTEHTAADGPGWYDDPIHNGNIQYWDGAQWTGQKQNKLVLEANAELAAQEAEQKRQRNVAIAMTIFGVGMDLAAGRKVQKNAQIMQDRRDSDQWERDRQARIRTEAARQQEKYYRNANNRRGW